ncbi:MAG: HK97 family phage prohead protease [Planctomycetaceae bacterium]|nr:HK97 family phage prohead protease [Planctomycetaceae bacterium]
MIYLGTVTALAVPWESNSFAWIGGDGWDSGGEMEMFRRGAFGDSLDTATVRSLVNHCKSAPLGGTDEGNLRVWQDASGVWFSLEIPDTPAGREARRQLDAGELCGASISFCADGYEWQPSGRPDSSKVKLVTRATLSEISLTGRPAYHATKTHFRWLPYATATTIQDQTTTQPRSIEGCPAMTEDTAVRCFKAQELRVGTTDGKPTITGLAVPYNAPSEDLGGFREIFKPGAFAESLANRDDIFADVEHDAKRKLGRRSAGTLALTETREGLRVTITPPDTSVGRDTMEEVRAGLLDGMSISFAKPQDRYTGTGANIVREINKATLRAVTLTSYPAYTQTAGTVALRSFSEYRARVEGSGPMPGSVLDEYMRSQPWRADIDRARARLDLEEAMLS